MAQGEQGQRRLLGRRLSQSPGHHAHAQHAAHAVAHQQHLIHLGILQNFLQTLGHAVQTLVQPRHARTRPAVGKAVNAQQPRRVPAPLKSPCGGQHNSRHRSGHPSRHPGSPRHPGGQNSLHPAPGQRRQHHRQAHHRQPAQPRPGQRKQRHGRDLPHLQQGPPRSQCMHIGHHRSHQNLPSPLGPFAAHQVVPPHMLYGRVDIGLHGLANRPHVPSIVARGQAPARPHLVGPRPQSRLPGRLALVKPVVVRRPLGVKTRHKKHMPPAHRHADKASTARQACS